MKFDISKIDMLLSQEMEDVKGGHAGTCECNTRAIVGGGGTICVCTSAAGQMDTDPEPQDPICSCSSVASLISPTT